MTTGQSREARIERLSDGRCPVHGLGMSQISRWYKDGDGRLFTTVSCYRRDCGIIAKAYGIDGPWALLESFSYLLDDE